MKFKDVLWLLAATPALLVLANCANIDTAQPDQFVTDTPRQEARTVPPETNATEPAGAVVVSYSPPVQQLTLHEPAFINFNVRNGLDRPVKLDLGQGRKGSFRLVVVRPDGTRVELPSWARDGISRVGAVSLDSQKELTERLLLNEWFDFPAPGRYEIEVSLATPIEGGDGKRVAARTDGRVVLDVRPRNAAELKRVSAELLDGVVKAPTYQDAADSATALSYVGDPVAVPDLQKALTSGRMVEPIAISGLERIGNEEAVQVLISALRGQNEEVAQLAHSALLNIQQKSPNLGLKEKIRQAL